MSRALMQHVKCEEKVDVFGMVQMLLSQKEDAL